MKIALVQMNPIVGNLKQNGQKILEFANRAYEMGADLVITPELSLTGYPPKDLVLRDDFLLAEKGILDEIAKKISVPTVVGAAIKLAGMDKPFNGAVLCHKNSWHLIAKKILLPNYNVFDEKRHFSEPAEKACSIVSIQGKKLLINICEDAWACLPDITEAKYSFDPIKNALNKDNNVDVIVNISASPFSVSKPRIREKIFTHLAKMYKTPVVMVGQVGGNDQLMFDGQSMVIDKAGEIIKRSPACIEDLMLYQLDDVTPQLAPKLDDEDLLIEIIAMGIKDYVEKCGALGIILGVSGGIDSALCAALAVRALGPKRVRSLFLPSRFSNVQSLRDSQLLADNLSIKLDVLPIESGLAHLRGLIWSQELGLDHRNEDVLDQNLQSRLRGLLIMAVSNATDYLMMTPSNKSELAVGYATIYGDLCGAFSPLGDVYKTQVYRLALALNEQAGYDLVPNSIIHRPPTAELKPEQLDTDTLPDYAILDKILFNFIDLEKSADTIANSIDIEINLINHVISMVNKSEYKRRQSPMPFMVSDKVFGDARRLPIAKQVRF